MEPNRRIFSFLRFLLFLSQYSICFHLKEGFSLFIQGRLNTINLFSIKFATIVRLGSNCRVAISIWEFSKASWYFTRCFSLLFLLRDKRKNKKEEGKVQHTYSFSSKTIPVKREASVTPRLPPNSQKPVNKIFSVPSFCSLLFDFISQDVLLERSSGLASRRHG